MASRTRRLRRSERERLVALTLGRARGPEPISVVMRQEQRLAGTLSAIGIDRDAARWAGNGEELRACTQTADRHQYQPRVNLLGTVSGSLASARRRWRRTRRFMWRLAPGRARHVPLGSFSAFFIGASACPRLKDTRPHSSVDDCAHSRYMPIVPDAYLPVTRSTSLATLAVLGRRSSQHVLSRCSPTQRQRT